MIKIGELIPAKVAEYIRRNDLFKEKRSEFNAE
jgi:hypothetical protein